MPNYFFMSYAHKDNETRHLGKVEEFYRDLRSQIAILTGDDEERTGFLDKTGLDSGEDWDAEIVDALGRCGVFVPILSASYFQRPYCGREWTVFEQRVERYLQQSPQPQRPALILPVLWARPAGKPMPDFARALQWSPSTDRVQPQHHPHCDLLIKKGLYYFMKRRANDQQAALFVTEMVDVLAESIVAAAQQHPLPVTDSLPPLREVVPKFPTPQNGHRRQAASALQAEPGAAASGALFAIVAACHDEVEPPRIHYYGPESREWRPFAPDDRKAVGLIANLAAGERDLTTYFAAIDDTLIQRLRRAETDHSVALLIVDPWTASLPRYEALLKEFDQYAFRNCVVIVAWSPGDRADPARAEQLRAVIRSVLGRRLATLRGPVDASSGLAQEIRRAIQELETRLAPERKAVREVDQGRFASVPQLSVRTSD